MKNLILTLIALVSLTLPCQATTTLSLTENVDYQVERLLVCNPKVSNPGFPMALLQTKLSLSGFSLDYDNLICFDGSAPIAHDKSTGLVLHFIKVQIVQGSVKTDYFVYGSFVQNPTTGEVVNMKVIAINKEAV